MAHSPSSYDQSSTSSSSPSPLPISSASSALLLHPLPFFLFIISCLLLIISSIHPSFASPRPFPDSPRTRPPSSHHFQDWALYQSGQLYSMKQMSSSSKGINLQERQIGSSPPKCRGQCSNCKGVCEPRPIYVSNGHGHAVWSCACIF